MKDRSRTSRPIRRQSRSIPPAALRWTALVLIVTAWAGSLAPPADAQGLDVLRQIEDRLLEKRLESYEEAFDREEQAKQALAESTEKLDVALGNRTVDVEQLRRMEAELSLANETVLLRAKETAQIRNEVYKHMERLAEIESELSGSGLLSGRWSIRFGESEEERGTVVFRADGTRIEGTYLLTSGRRGSLNGSFLDGRVELERIDSETGLDLKLLGQLSADEKVLRGSWQTFELASGSRTQGGWVAQRLGR